MAFYDLDKTQRNLLVAAIKESISEFFLTGAKGTLKYFSDEDTYIRKTAYLAIGKIYFGNKNLRKEIIDFLDINLYATNEKVRQTAINAAGEIGIKEFDTVEHFFDLGLFDKHHIVRNAVIGSVKKMGEKNPVPVLTWANKYLNHTDKEVRREICHGIELRGRTHPEDILPMLIKLQFDKTSRVRNTLVHVLGQIAYKKNCLPIVIDHLKLWENKELVFQALEEIVDVHDRYKNFSALTQKQAIEYIAGHFKR